MDSGGGRILKLVRNVMYGGGYGSVRSPGAGRCMYVHGNDESDVLWQR